MWRRLNSSPIIRSVVDRRDELPSGGSALAADEQGDYLKQVTNNQIRKGKWKQGDAHGLAAVWTPSYLMTAHR